MSARLDDAELVLVAAAATGLGADVLLDGCDVRGVASVVAATERATTPTGAAAALLVAMERHRPFPSGNLATAWLAAAHLVAADGLRLHVDPPTARRLSACGDVEAVEQGLVALARPRTGAFRRWFVEPRPPSPTALPCPTCGRLVPLRAADACLVRGPWALSAHIELRARCAVAGGPHLRDGRPRQLVPA